MKIKSFSNQDGHLCFVDEEGSVVDISGCSTLEAHNYEKKNNVKVREMVREFGSVKKSL